MPYQRVPVCPDPALFEERFFLPAANPVSGFVIIETKNREFPAPPSADREGYKTIMQEYLMIGTVLKPQGIHGECKIKSYASDMDLFADWDTLYLEENGSFQPLPCRVTRIRDGFVYAVLGQCSSPDDVEKLRGRELYVDRAHAAPPEENAVYIADLIGCEARDLTGNTVGVLTDVLQHGPVDTWVFRTKTGSLMAPALLRVFPAVDPENRLITVDAERLQEVAVVED